MPADQPTSLYAQSAPGGSPKSYEEQPRGSTSRPQGSTSPSSSHQQESYQQETQRTGTCARHLPDSPPLRASQSSAAQQPTRAPRLALYERSTTSGGYDFPGPGPRRWQRARQAHQAGPSQLRAVGAASGSPSAAASNASSGGESGKTAPGAELESPLVASVVVTTHC